MNRQSNASFPELRPFDLPILLTVGIDRNGLEEGETGLCRFWAIYSDSEPQTPGGALCRDTVRLESAFPEEDEPFAEQLGEKVAILGRIEALLQAATAPRLERTLAPAALTKPVTQPEKARQSEREPPCKEPERPVLDKDIPRRRSSRDARPAIRNGLLDAPCVNELAKQLSAGALSWRSALGQLREQIAQLWRKDATTAPLYDGDRAT